MFVRSMVLMVDIYFFYAKGLYLVILILLQQLKSYELFWVVSLLHVHEEVAFWLGSQIAQENQ